VDGPVKSSLSEIPDELGLYILVMDELEKEGS
jgi:hypothetical protein